MTEFEKVLAECELADGLEEADLRKLAAIAEPKVFARDDIIIREDDTNCDIFILYEGWVSIEIQRFPYDASAQKLRVLRNKGVVGEFSFIDRSRRSATVRAQEEAKLLMLPCARLETLLATDHRVGYLVMRNIGRLLCARIRNTNFELRNQLIW
ncbi:MAG: cyclic nucleotide-binding domain-containing protein [Nitrospinae bacterium]|nr:cyclic nucleotide-binding domain-containing protein [Nitrospinota bacterium]